MRALLTWLVQGIPFSARSRRAIDETLADWKIEEDAGAPAARPITTLRGALAIGRVVSISIARETGDFSWCRGLGLRLGAVVGVLFLLALLMTSPMLEVLGARLLMLSAAILPSLLFGIAPPAVFLMLAWRPVSQSVPTAGAAIVVGVATLAMGVWMVPMGSEFFGNVLRDGLELGNAGPPTRGRPAVMPVTGRAALTGAAALLAVVVARRSPLESRWWLVGVPMCYWVGFTVLYFFVFGLPLLLLFHIGDTNPLGTQLATWTAASLTVAAALTLMRRTGRGAIPSTD
jgi:hypothetical protein